MRIDDESNENFSDAVAGHLFDQQRIRQRLQAQGRGSCVGSVADIQYDTADFGLVFQMRTDGLDDDGKSDGCGAMRRGAGCRDLTARDANSAAPQGRLAVVLAQGVTGASGAGALGRSSCTPGPERQALPTAPANAKASSASRCP